MTTRLTYLVKFVYSIASNIVYTDASGQVTVGVWINPNEDGIKFSWQVKWPDDIIPQKLSFTNTGGTITNSDL